MSKKPDIEVVLINVLFTISSVLIVNLSSELGLILIGIYRVFLIRYSYNKLNFNFFNIKTIIGLLVLYLCVVTFVLSTDYGFAFFNIKVVLGILLATLFVLSFKNILDSTNNGNFTFFIGIALFVISTLFFRIILIYYNFEKHTNEEYLMLFITKLAFNVAYFFINQSFLQNEKKSKKLLTL